MTGERVGEQAIFLPGSRTDVVDDKGAAVGTLGLWSALRGTALRGGR